MKKIQVISLTAGFLIYLLVTSELLFTIYPNGMNKVPIHSFFKLFAFIFPLVMACWLIAFKKIRNSLIYFLLPLVLSVAIYCYVMNSFSYPIPEKAGISGYLLLILIPYGLHFVWIITTVACLVHFALARKLSTSK